jgi:preprotein translocase subunit SecA
MDWDVKGLGEYLEHVCLKPGQVQQAFDELTETTRDAMIDALVKMAREFYTEREEYVREAGADMREIERVVLLGAVDKRWMDHIDAMDRLREGIGLRAYGHRDPVVEYKTEGYQMFEEMIHLIQEDTLRRLYFFELQRAPERRQVAQPVTTNVDAVIHGQAPRACAEEGGTQRSLPLRQRQEVQVLLRPRRSQRLRRASPGISIYQNT